MDYRDRLEKLEIDAALIGVSLRELCIDAGEASNNVYRWRSGAVDPQIGLFGRVMGALETALRRRQEKIFFALAPKFLPEHILAQLDLRERAGEDAGAASQGAAPASPAAHPARRAQL